MLPRSSFPCPGQTEHSGGGRPGEVGGGEGRHRTQNEGREGGRMMQDEGKQGAEGLCKGPGKIIRDGGEWG
jgi:hypothetical protein